MIDNEFIITVPKSEKTTLIPKTDFSNIFSFHNYHINRSHYIFSYLILVIKNYQVLVYSQFVNTNITLYDGPGFTFPLINSDEKYYRTSTFQCIIQVLQETSNVKFKNTSIIFSAKPLNIAEYLEISGRVIPFGFPRESCLSMLCMIELKTQDDYQINITILNIFSLKRKTSSCLLWGLVTVEHFNNNYKESHCKHLGYSLSVHFYSSISSLIQYYLIMKV